MKVYIGVSGIDQAGDPIMFAHTFKPFIPNNFLVIATQEIDLGIDNDSIVKLLKDHQKQFKTPEQIKIKELEARLSKYESK